MTVRLCFVGYGAIAGEHASIFRSEGAVLHTAVGRVPEDTARFAEEFGFRYHTTDLSWALAQDDVDAVVVASPSALHFEQTRQALLAGRHALVEIPLAMSYAEGAELVRLARDQDRTLMVAHSQRFIPSLSAVRGRVVTGALRVYHILGRFGLMRRENVGWTGRRRSWTDNLLWHHACHLVDFSLWFLGARQAQVSAQVARPDPRTGTFMDLDITLRTPADQLVALSLSYHTHLRFNEYMIVGEEESLHFDSGRLTGPEGVRDDPKARGQDFNRLAWEAQDREFLSALREGREPAMSGAEALPALAVLQEVQDRFIAPLVRLSP